MKLIIGSLILSAIGTYIFIWHFGLHHVIIKDVTNNNRRDVRLLIFVPTNPRNREKSVAVFETWGKRVDKILFMGSFKDKELPVGVIRSPEVMPLLWRKVREAFKYVYDHHLHDVDWFMKADDDTFVVVENLERLLSPLDPTKPYYIGHWASGELDGGYNGGGAGYVISKAALKLFIETGMKGNYVVRVLITHLTLSIMSFRRVSSQVRL